MGRLRKYIPTQEMDEAGELYRKLDVLENRVKVLEDMLNRRNSHGPWIEPTFINGFAQAPAGIEPFAYRIYTNGEPEFKGHISTVGATSGTVAFNIPIDSDPTMWTDDNYYFTINTDLAGAFVAAMVYLDPATGDVSIFWPIS